MNGYRTIVLGLGNSLNRDEGVGVHALNALAERLAGQTGSLELLDGGVLGLSLLPLVEASSHLLVLDAIDARQAPGTLVDLRREDIPLYAGVKLSQHQVTFQEVLGLANIRDRLPPYLHMVGVQPADLSIGVDLSPTVQAVIPRLVDRAIAVLQAWSLLPEGDRQALTEPDASSTPKAAKGTRR